MKQIFIKLKDALFIPMCIIMVCYCLFNEQLRELAFINLIRYTILGLLSVLALGLFFELSDKKNTKKGDKKELVKTKKITNFLYSHSEYIVNYLFYIYFFIYMILMLDKQSIVYNYLLLVIFGMFLGYRFALKTYYFFKNKELQ